MKNSKQIAKSAMICALYVCLTYITNTLGLASGIIQVRFSEALCILPIFTPTAVPGLFIGCLISNLLTGCALFDVIFGSIATLLGAVGTLYIGRKNKWLAAIPPIISNTLIIPFVLSYVYNFDGSIFYFAFTVFIGELISHPQPLQEHDHSRKCCRLPSKEWVCIFRCEK